MAIVPDRLYEHTPDALVSTLGDGPFAFVGWIPCGVLARRQAEKAHEFPGRLETADFVYLRQIAAADLTWRHLEQFPNQATNIPVRVLDAPLLKSRLSRKQYCDVVKLLVCIHPDPCDTFLHDRLIRMRLWRLLGRQPAINGVFQSPSSGGLAWLSRNWRSEPVVPYCLGCSAAKPQGGSHNIR